MSVLTIEPNSQKTAMAVNILTIRRHRNYVERIVRITALNFYRWNKGPELPGR
jgi:hypothetical protein